MTHLEKLILSIGSLFCWIFLVTLVWTVTHKERPLYDLMLKGSLAFYQAPNSRLTVKNIFIDASGCEYGIKVAQEDSSARVGFDTIFVTHGNIGISFERHHWEQLQEE